MSKKERSNVYMNTHYGLDSEEAIIKSFTKDEIEIGKGSKIEDGDKVKLQPTEGGDIKMYKICMERGQNAPEISRICIDKKIGDEIKFKNREYKIVEALR